MLLVAQLVFQEAVVRHRAERTKLSQRMVMEAQRSLAEARRQALLSSWARKGEHPLSCPRCGNISKAQDWVSNDDAPPPWAQRYAEANVSAARRYACTECEFELTYVATA